MIVNDKYILYDVETGNPYEVSKKYYEEYIKFWDESMPQFKTDKTIGVPIICGTSGDMTNLGELEKIFYKPKGYNLVPIKSYWKDEGPMGYFGLPDEPIRGSGINRPILPPVENHGICGEGGCDKPATKDYNGHGHWVCDKHYDSLSDFFDENYA